MKWGCGAEDEEDFRHVDDLFPRLFGITGDERICGRVNGIIGLATSDAYSSTFKVIVVFWQRLG
jgi:hypothetical protein